MSTTVDITESRQIPVKDVVRDVSRIVSRYVLAVVLFPSGMQMVFNIAGIHNGPVEWVTPLGEFSGARFAGIWLGISPIFQGLGGVVEVAAGLLLLSRKTTTLGAMIATGCLANALMLHFCFRPSPWVAGAILLLLSSHLVLLDWRVLVDLLFLDRPTTPLSTEVPWETPQTRKIGMVLKVSLLIYFVYTSVQTIQTKRDAEARSELSGVYAVTSFSPPDAGLKYRWRVAAIDRYAERLTIRTMDGAGKTFQIQPLLPPGAATGHLQHVAAVAGLPSLALVAPNGSVSMLSYSRPSAEHLTLRGELEGVAITADLGLMSSDSLPFVSKNSSFAESR